MRLRRQDKSAVNPHAYPLAQSPNLKRHDVSMAKHFWKHILKSETVLFVGEHSG